jgi:hypothetical protein
VSVTEAIQNDWANEPGVRDACLRVLQALTNEEKRLDHYSFGDLLRFAAEDDQKVVARAVMYLANPSLRVLETCLMYEFRGYFYDLPKEEIQHYAKGEVVYHPELGQPLSSSEILVCFAPGVGLKEQAAR